MNILRRYSSILLIIVFITFVTPKSSFAQSDTPGTTAKTDSIIEYLTPLEYAFMMHEETKFMLRVPALGFGAEVEILPYSTLMGQAQYLSGYYDYNTGLIGEARFYYGSRKKGVSNMSGNYFGLGYQYQSDFNSITSNSNTNQFYARWGMQRRFLGVGLIDLGVKIGYEKHGRQWESHTHTNERFFLQTSGTIGLGLVFNKETALDNDRLCPALKCFERETFLLKINTLNLLTFKYSDRQKESSIRINPQVGVEQKLFNSPFSINANVKLNYNWVTKTDHFFSGAIYSELHGRIHVRYYYNLKNRILKGKSGNGFSANYISGGVLRMYDSNWNGPFKLNDNEITLTTGIQRTFSKRLYFDVEVGVAFDKEWNYAAEFFGDVQVGIKF